jgi:hypothetical protein
VLCGLGNAVAGWGCDFDDAPGRCELEGAGKAAQNEVEGYGRLGSATFGGWNVGVLHSIGRWGLSPAGLCEAGEPCMEESVLFSGLLIRIGSIGLLRERGRGFIAG